MGTKVQDYYPHFKGLIDQSFVAYDPNQIFDQVDVLFLCPHGVSMEIAKAAQAHDVKVIVWGRTLDLRIAKSTKNIMAFHKQGLIYLNKRFAVA